jgi:hypothetical protein
MNIGIEVIQQGVFGAVVYARQVHWSLSGNTTATSISHLRKKYRKLLQEEEIVPEQHNQEIVQNLVHAISTPRFSLYLLRWIVCCHISFTEVEDKDFQAVLTEVNILIKPYGVSWNAILNWAKSDFIEAQQQIVAEVLGTAISRIHILFDLWTYSNGYASIAEPHFACHFTYILSFSVICGDALNPQWVRPFLRNEIKCPAP